MSFCKQWSNMLELANKNSEKYIVRSYLFNVVWKQKIYNKGNAAPKKMLSQKCVIPANFLQGECERRLQFILTKPFCLILP